MKNSFSIIHNYHIIRLFILCWLHIINCTNIIDGFPKFNLVLKVAKKGMILYGSCERFVCPKKILVYIFSWLMLNRLSSILISLAPVFSISL